MKPGPEYHFNFYQQIARDKSGLLSLYLPQVTKEDEGEYSVKASNSAGDAKCYAKFTVLLTDKKDAMKLNLRAPGFTQLFSDQVASRGKSITFECVVTGNPKPQVRLTSPLTL